jgi:hypothetical protein
MRVWIFVCMCFESYVSRAKYLLGHLNRKIKTQDWGYNIIAKTNESYFILHSPKQIQIISNPSKTKHSVSLVQVCGPVYILEDAR